MKDCAESSVMLGRAVLASSIDIDMLKQQHESLTGYLEFTG